VTARDAAFLAWLALMSAALLTLGIFWVIHRWGNYPDDGGWDE